MLTKLLEVKCLCLGQGNGYIRKELSNTELEIGQRQCRSGKRDNNERDVFPPVSEYLFSRPTLLKCFCFLWFLNSFPILNGMFGRLSVLSKSLLSFLVLRAEGQQAG